MAGSVAALEATPNPLDMLPDLSTIDARAAGEAPTAAVVCEKPHTSTTSKAILATVGLATAATALFGAAPAQAQGWGHQRGGHQPNYNNHGYNHRHHHGGNNNNNNNAIIGGIILGAIIGGAIANQAPPPVYYPPVQQYPQYPQQVREPFRDNYGRLVCPDANGGWYVSADAYQCRSSRY